MTEIWKDVPGYEGRLEASNLGRVRVPSEERFDTNKFIANVKPGSIYSPWLAKNGYLCIAVQDRMVRRKLLVHRLVALAFLEGNFEGATVNHIDHDRTNNAVTNLEWMTRSQNTADVWSSGIVAHYGEKHPCAILSDAEALAIYNARRLGEPAQELAERFGVSIALIYKIARGKRRGLLAA